jgi:hypothetical protein
MCDLAVDAFKGTNVNTAFFTLARDAVRRFADDLPPTRDLYGGGQGMLPPSVPSLVQLCVAYFVAQHGNDLNADVMAGLPAELQERVYMMATRKKQRPQGA